MGIIKAIINDLKTDIQFLIKVGKGEYKCPYTLKQIIDIRPMLKDAQTWIFFMIIIAALLTGTFVSAKYYQFEANEEIIKAQEFVDLHCLNISDRYYNIPSADFTEIMKEMNQSIST